MDCHSAAETLSAAHDGPVSAEALALAEEHCSQCPDCAAFREMLARIDGFPAPEAPPELVEGLLALGAETATAIRSEQTAQTPSEKPAAFERRPSLFARWTPRLTAYVAAAAVLLMAVGITTASLLDLGGTHQAAESDRTTGSADSLESAPPATEGGEKDGSAGATAESAAPSYVTLDLGVWLLRGPASPLPSSLTTAGIVTSSLDAPGTPEQLNAYQTGSDADTLYVLTADGTYLGFGRVTRTLGRSPYQLKSGTLLQQYGQWPTLPEAYPQPTEADGSPTFRFFGIDDLGVEVYVPPTGRVENGFAVPPDTALTDPAAGNPGWTWWQPFD